MQQVLLAANRRVSTAGCAIGLLLMINGGLVSALASWTGAWAIVGGVIIGGGAALLIMAMRAWLRPRLALSGGDLLVYLKPGRPYRVPVDAVEVFFLGQTEAELPGKQLAHAESRNVVVRLSQSAREWHGQPVTPRLGQWFGGYIVIRGMWCEPINEKKVTELNRKLVEAHRATGSAPNSVGDEERDAT